MTTEAAASVDTVWAGITPHIEWPEGFALVLLFAGHPRPVEELRQRAEQSVRDRKLTAKVLRPQSVDGMRRLVGQVIERPGSDCGLVWVSLLGQAGTKAWDEAAAALLRQLNERRFLLERDVGVPMVLVLPLELRKSVYVLAPDLWTVRSFVDVVPAPQDGAMEGRSRGTSRAVGTLTAVRGSSSGGRSRAEREWARLLSSEGGGGVAAEDGIAAFENATQRGDWHAARIIAEETLAVVLRQYGISRLDDVGWGQVQEARSRWDRNLVVAILNMGTVELMSGNLAGARELVGHAVVVAEVLAGDDLDNAQAQRDLFISLDRLGRVELQAGNLSAARTLFDRSLAIAERLAGEGPDSAEAQRDLSVALETLGNVEVQASNLSAARTLVSRSLQLAEKLAGDDPDNAEVQRDLSVALNKLGDVEVRAGNLSAARRLLVHSLAIVERLAGDDPDSALTQRDLSVALNKLGEVEVQAGDLSAARILFNRDLAIAEKLAGDDPNNAQAGHDLAISLVRMALVAQAEGRTTDEQLYLRRAKDVLDAMVDKGQMKGVTAFDEIRRHVERRLK